MSVKKEFETIALAHRMDLFTIVYLGSAEEAKAMADVGAGNATRNRRNSVVMQTLMG